MVLIISKSIIFLFFLILPVFVFLFLRRGQSAQTCEADEGLHMVARAGHGLSGQHTALSALARGSRGGWRRRPGGWLARQAFGQGARSGGGWGRDLSLHCGGLGGGKIYPRPHPF